MFYLILIFTIQVPELAGFWLLTIIPQLPLILFLLLNNSMLVLPLERAVSIIETAFILFEIIAGYLAIRAMVNHQVAKFHLQNFSNLEELPADDYLHHGNGYVHPHEA